MKRLTAALLAATMLFLCACTGSETNGGTSGASQTAATLPQKESVAADEGWNASLLPVPFAREPQGCKTLSTAVIEPSVFKSPYTCAATRIQLRCLPEQMNSFSDEMISLGYIGGISFYKNNDIYGDSVIGHWTNDEYFATIYESEKTTVPKDGMEYTLTLDVVKCENTIPEILTMAFPGIETAWTRNAGDYTGMNDYGVESAKPDETLSDSHWAWNFKGGDAFVGVTKTEYEKYLYDLTVRGFDGYSEKENDGTGMVEYFSAEYEYGENTYGVYLCYISYLSTLEMIFSNDITFFYSEEAE